MIKQKKIIKYQTKKIYPNIKHIAMSMGTNNKPENYQKKIITNTKSTVLKHYTIYI